MLLDLVERYGVVRGESLPTAEGRGVDFSNPVIAVNHDSCILCDRCVRACDDIQGNDVIGRSGKGYATRIAFDLNDPMGESSCVTCGECVAACPTGALVNRPIRETPIRPREELDSIDTVCPYCGVGCALTFHVDRERNAISFADGREQPGSQKRLCVKGRYGWDYASSPQRLTTPLIRIEGSYPKGPLSEDVRGDGQGKRKPGGHVDYDEVMPHFREASWEEALDLVGERLRGIRDEHGSSAIAGFGSAKCSNEEAYLFQKLIRAGFGTNNVDHCTRLCHASSVAALFEGVGSGAVSTTYGDIINADVAILAGTNTTANHPVASSFFKQARRRGTKLIVVDPRRERIADHADVYCQIKPGTDVAFYNGVLHEIIAQDWVDREFVQTRTSNFGELAKMVRQYPPERAAQICGVDADAIRLVARLWGTADAAVVYWGMGISQHTTGTDNARCLIALCAITGNVGRQGTGLHPLRGQNNVQGASDAGLIPMMYPDYQIVDGPGVREKFEAVWERELDPERGLTVTEIIGSALQGGVRGHVHDGREPVPVGPEHQQGPQGALHARLPRGAGRLPHRDGRVRRRGAARHLLHGEGRDLHEHRPARAARLQGARGARRGARGLADHPGGLQPRRAADGLRPPERDLRRARLGDAQLRRADLRQPRPGRQAVPELRTPSTPTARSCSSTSASAPTTARPTWSRRSGCRPRSCPTRSTPSS